MWKNAVTVSLRLFLLLALITGILYPLTVTIAGNLMFPWQAKGSLVYNGSKPCGSILIGQPSDSAHFQCRPSAAGFSTVPSGASNLAIGSTVLNDSMQKRAARLGKSVSELPADLLFSSGSGVDPHISPEAAIVQVDRIARVRKLSPVQIDALKKKVISSIEESQYFIFGNKRVNVLRLNAALDSIDLQTKVKTNE